jgi:hypothetical protein
MIILFFLIGVFIVAIAVVGPALFFYSRQQGRDLKNYERGLKMVPLLIHLPPISDDIEVGSRDTRDVMDENISKAQVLYNIIASTHQKGFKPRFYGQRHFAFEIVGSHGFVYFYALVPVGLLDVVKQGIASAYPSAVLEETTEHNIFNTTGKASGVSGGELVLKESFAYPIASFQDLKRDAVQSLLNSLSTLGKEDGAGIQILLRPADPGWSKKAQEVAKNKREGKNDSSLAIDLLKDVGKAFVKAPDEKDESSDKPKLSSLDQATVDAIEDKTRHPGYEVLIRVVASSNFSQRSQNMVQNIISAFALFDAPGRNGFKYEPAKDLNELTAAYNLKSFPQQNNDNILSSVELASVFHFPDQNSIPTSQLERQGSKQVDGPRNMPQEGLMLGYNVYRGAKKPIRISLSDRQRHMYAVGQTGTGKSTFLENLALQDMLNGDGFAFVDPHGDTAEKLLSMIPRERTEDVIYFCPSEMDFPLGLNLFEFDSPDQKDFLIQETLNMLQKLYDPQHTGIMGPRYEDMFRNAALAVMADPGGSTFLDIPQLFRDPQYLKQKLSYVQDKTVLDFWQKQFPAMQRSNDAGEVTAWFLSKFGAFLSNQMMRNIIGQTKSAFNLRDIMDNKKVLLVNLSKGRTGDLNSKLLGMIFVMKFQAAAMSRSNIPEHQRQDFCLYVDEFQNFSTDSFATIMSEARKYHLNLIVANQFVTQLTEEIRDAVFGNMGTVVSFRIGQNDVDALSRYFTPSFDGDDLLRVPSYNTITRTLVGGVPTQPFSMMTLPPLGSPKEGLADALKQLSAAKYGKPKASIEKEIFSRLEAKPEPSASSSLGAPRPAGMPGGAPAGAAPMTGARPASSPFAQPTTAANPGSTSSAAPQKRPSFMDEWLRKSGKQTPPYANQPSSSTNSSTPSPAPAQSQTTDQAREAKVADASKAAERMSTPEAEEAAYAKDVEDDFVVSHEAGEQTSRPQKPQTASSPSANSNHQKRRKKRRRNRPSQKPKTQNQHSAVVTPPPGEPERPNQEPASPDVPAAAQRLARDLDSPPPTHIMPTSSGSRDMQELKQLDQPATTPDTPKNSAATRPSDAFSAQDLQPTDGVNEIEESKDAASAEAYRESGEDTHADQEPQEIDLRTANRTAENELSHGDTIYIDREGVLHQKH